MVIITNEHPIDGKLRNIITGKTKKMIQQKIQTAIERGWYQVGVTMNHIDGSAPSWTAVMEREDTR